MSVCPRARRTRLSYSERKRSIDLPRGPHYGLHRPWGVDVELPSVTIVLASARRGAGVLAFLVAVACAAPAPAQEPAPSPDPAPAEAAPSPAATPAPTATPDPAPSPKPTGAAAGRSTTRRQPVPAAPPRPVATGRPRSAPVVRTVRATAPARRVTAAPVAPARRSTATTTRRAGTHAKRAHRRHKPIPHRRSRRASDGVATSLHRVAAPVFPTVVSAPALSAHATRRPPERPLALAGGALLALVVASCGLLVLTARGERERIGT